MSADVFFGVPLLVRDVESPVRDAIGVKVAAYLKSEAAGRDVTASPEESVTTSYYRADASILVDAGLEELEELVRAAASNFIERVLKLPPRRFEIERAWINLFEPGSQEGQHSHDGSLLSCSYYVAAPANCGCLVFPDPIGARRSYRQFTRTRGSDLLTRSDIAVEPQPGRLVMFESWLPHYIQCNKSDQVRISIAINLREATKPTVSLPAGAADVPAPAPDAEIRHETPAAFRPTTAAGRPFLFNELFEVRHDLRARLEPVRDAIPTVVIDDFLKYPDRVREIVGSTPAANWKHEAGGRNFSDYYDCRLRFPIRFPNHMVAVAQQTIKRVFSLDTRPQDASMDVNWFMQIQPKRADFAVPHADITEGVRRSFTCIVYLNSNQECSGGTAFFRFRRSSSLVFDEVYAHAVRTEPGLGETGRDYWPAAAESQWENVGAVDMLPGRLLIFPSEYFHAAYHPLDSFYEFPRLTLAFWMVC